MHIKTRTTCRICNSSALKPVIDLGSQFLQGSFVKPGKEMPSSRKIPCTLVRCDPGSDENACGLLQLKHTVPPEVLYSAYWYRSGTNATMRGHLKGIVSEATALVNKRDAIVLDIGCNDGTLLSYYPKTTIRYGVDPSDVSQSIEGDILTVQDIFPSKKLIEILEGKKLDIITSIAMFYDLESPVDFVKEVKRLLAPRGVWVLEMHYMPEMLSQNSFDTICHEHLEYYSLSVVEHILKLAGMKVFRVSFNDINGGSIRCFATHDTNIIFDSKGDTQFLNEVRQKEFDLELDTDRPYIEFWERIKSIKADLYQLLTKLKKEGKKIHIYGASTKGNTILQWCGIDHSIIDVASERNPEKHGARTLGTNIPIVSEEESRAMSPDYYLVLPWHFRKEFVEREKQILESGTKFIFPLPNIEIFGGK